FKSAQRGIAHGAFFFDTPFASFVNTHLEALPSRNGALQNTQLSQLVQWMKTATFVAGDLNIAWGTPSYNLSILKTDFYDPYNENRAFCSPHDATCSELFNKWSKPKGPGYVIYDYIVFYGNHPPSMQTTLVPFFDFQGKTSPLSDHQGLLTHAILNQTQEQ
ncbi:MAG TPA: hypothetical protein PLO43_02750, partial [Chlamydiales bacterium]|nr:hypothetical protein [Chlamydiales bacterium]